MDSLIFHVLAWPTFLVALLVFGFAPGAILRLIILAYEREDPRRQELLSELYHVPRIERPFWVAEQLETALFDGLRGRLAAWRAKRPFPALVYLLDPGRDKVLTLELTLAAKLQAPDVQLDELCSGISQAMSEHVHLVHGANGVQRASELTLDALCALRVEHCLVRGARPEDHRESGHTFWLRRLPGTRPNRCWRELRHRWRCGGRSGPSRAPW